VGASTGRWVCSLRNMLTKPRSATACANATRGIVWTVRSAKAPTVGVINGRPQPTPAWETASPQPWMRSHSRRRVPAKLCMWAIAGTTTTVMSLLLA